MLTRALGRLGGAVVLALGLLVATSMPASASATGFVAEASSTLNVVLSNGSPTFINFHTKEHATTNVCAPNSTPPPVTPVSFDSLGGGTIGASNGDWFDFVIGTNTYKMRVVTIGGSFVLSATGATLQSAVRLEFRTCSSTTVLCTTNTINMTMTGPSVGLHPTASTSGSVSGGSTAITTVPGCNFILSLMLNGSQIQGNVDLHFV